MSETKTKEKETVGAMKSLKMTNSKFLNKFLPSFNELSSIPSTKKAGRLKYAIKQTLGSIQTTIEGYNKKRQVIFEDRCKMDEDGNPIFDKDKNYLFRKKDKENDFRKEAFDELKKHDDKEITLTVYPVSHENLKMALGVVSIGMELNLEGFILPSEEELELLAEIKKEEELEKKKA